MTMRTPPERDDRPAMRVFRNITRLWDLSSAEQQALLGNLAASTLDGWMQAADDSEPLQLPANTYQWLGHLCAVHDLLTRVRGITAGLAWPHRPNPANLFCGRALLAYMADFGLELIETRAFLNAIAQGRTPGSPVEYAEFRFTAENSRIQH